MPSLVPEYEYDVFISYRQNDNRSGWVTQFVNHLRSELSATIKDQVNIYFDENPHDGLLDTHHVDKSLEGKLKCILFIPVLSRTYCDPKCFAWNHEFLAFNKLIDQDAIGPHVKLPNGNVTARVLPVQIHDLDTRDQRLYESSTKGALRSIDFTFRSQGVNRPLLPDDPRTENSNRFVYRDQINKLANAISEIILSLILEPESAPVSVNEKPKHNPAQTTQGLKPARWFFEELRRRNVPRAGIVYVVFVLLLQQILTRVIPGYESLAPVLGLFVAVGFMMALVLAWLFELGPDGWIRTTSPASASNPYKPSQKKPFTSSWVIIGLVTLLAIQYYYYQNQYLDHQAQANNDKSIAVLPFENRSDNKNDSYLSDGFTDDIINRLYLLGELRVISRASSQTYKGSSKSIKTIADELKVSTILTGSVQRVGDILKITVQLQNGTSDELIWGDIFQRTSTDLLSVQAEIARQVANVLKIKLDELVQARLNKKPTENSTAYEYFLKGRSLFNYNNPDSTDQAIAQYKMAIALDPNYALAYSGLGDAYGQLHARFARGVQWIDSGIVAGSKAVKLDSTSSDAYKALALAYNYARQYDTAFALLKKAVEKNPYNAQAISNLGTSYFFKLEYGEALRLHKRAAGLNPRNATPFQLVGWIYRLLGDLPEAESWLTTSINIDGRFWDTYRELAFAYCSEGKNSEALKLIPKMFESVNRDTRPLENAARIAHFAGDTQLAKSLFQESIKKNVSYQSDPNTLSAIGLGQIFLEEGNKVEAEIYLTHALELNLNEIKKGSPDDDPPFNVAAIYAIQGKRAESLQWLQNAIEKKWIDYAQVEYGPYFVKFRADSEFQLKLSGVRIKVAAIREAALSH